MDGQEMVVRQGGAGVGAMTLKQVADRVNLVHQVLEGVMKKGCHFGTVPGCGTKLVLLKPGADVLAMTFRLVPQFQVSRNDLEAGHREYDVTCSMYGPDGTLLGQGVGSASTMEKKYRYRWEGEGSHRRKVENEDIADVYNTVLKIAKKRAHIDATLTVTGAADLFTQDLIDEDDSDAKPPVSMPTAKPKPDAAPENPAGGDKELTVTGTYSDVAEKKGKAKDGKPWTKWAVQMGGAWYATFDSEIANILGDHIGEPVVVTYTTDGKYNTIVSVDAPETEGGQAAGGESEELPFSR